MGTPPPISPTPEPSTIKTFAPTSSGSTIETFSPTTTGSEVNAPPTMHPTHTPPTMYPTHTPPTPFPTETPPTSFPTQGTCKLKGEPCTKASDCCKNKCNTKKQICKK